MILVDIFIPSLDEVYDFRVDETAKVINIIQEISEIMCRKYKTELNTKPENFFLGSMEQCRVLGGNTTLKENGIRNGDRLFMV